MTDKKNPKWVPQLLAWYDVHKRELPWRGCGDPYKIWVSEVMSQQTRIEAMKPYYDNWMRLFPTLEDWQRPPKIRWFMLGKGLAIIVVLVTCALA